MNDFYQQGDEICEKMDGSLPGGAKLDRTKNLMKSPVTGHAHKLKTGSLYRLNADRFVKGPAVIVHEEHDDLILPKGFYRVKTVMEYDHMTEESREVID